MRLRARVKIIHKNFAVDFTLVFRNCNTFAGGNVLDVVIFNGTTYIPFAANWAPGKKYIYNLVFGKSNGGYDEDGKDVLVPVSFTVTVDDFTTVVENDVNMFQ